jgi:hypothetical protein
MSRVANGESSGHSPMLLTQRRDLLAATRDWARRVTLSWRDRPSLSRRPPHEELGFDLLEIDGPSRLINPSTTNAFTTVPPARFVL